MTRACFERPLMHVAFKNELLRRALFWQATNHCRHMRRGPPVKLNLACIIDRIYHVCRTGCQWSGLRVENGSYKTVYHYFNAWTKARLFEHAFHALSSSKEFASGPVSVDTQAA